MMEGPALVRSIFARWKSIEDEKAVLGEDSKELFQEAKSHGLDTKALRAAFRQKVKDDEPVTAKMQEHDALVDLYLTALGTENATQARVAREDQNPESPSNRDASTGGEASGTGTVPQDARSRPSDGEAAGNATEPQTDPAGDAPVPAGREGHSAKGEGALSSPENEPSSEKTSYSQREPTGEQQRNTLGVTAGRDRPRDAGPIPAFLDRSNPACIVGRR